MKYFVKTELKLIHEKKIQKEQNKIQNIELNTDVDETKIKNFDVNEMDSYFDPTQHMQNNDVVEDKTERLKDGEIYMRDLIDK